MSGEARIKLVLIRIWAVGMKIHVLITSLEHLPQSLSASPSTTLSATQPHCSTSRLSRMLQHSHTREPDEAQQRNYNKVTQTHGTSPNPDSVFIATNPRPRDQLVPRSRHTQGFDFE